jgi:hypothetical protein
MFRTLLTLLVGASLLMISQGSAAGAQAPDGTMKITSRSVSPGIGLSWGDGVLTYKGQDYPFTFQAKGLFRDVDANVTATELSGEVFNLKSVTLFNGTYHKVEEKSSEVGAGTRATMKNLNGVIVNLVSTVEARKFNLGRDGITIKLEKQKM